MSSVRPSHDGHAFHAVWAARQALELISPHGRLIGVSVEGPAPGDPSKQTADLIADVALYYAPEGTDGDVELDTGDAQKVFFVQCKYSVSKATSPVRAAQIGDVVKEFAKVFSQDRASKPPANQQSRELRFELVTNRPIWPALEQAVTSLGEGLPSRGLSQRVKDQRKRLKEDSGLSGEMLAGFFSKLSLTGKSGSLAENQRALSRDIRAVREPIGASSRHIALNVVDLVRERAGTSGAFQNLISKNDVLAALDVSERDIFPCRGALPESPFLAEVHPYIERQQLQEAVNMVSSKPSVPILIHAEGGVGKTVFLRSLAAKLESHFEVLMFDCFGGGNYRSREDRRHLAARGLAHMANTLASRDRCKLLILPDNADSGKAIEAFRERLEQAVAQPSGDSQKPILLCLDAIDNAASFAHERGEEAFPTLLLDSLARNPIKNVCVVATCRTERKDISVLEDCDCGEIRLPPFALEETQRYLRKGKPGMPTGEIQGLHGRSVGNPRVLSYLLDSDWLSPDKGSPVKLDTLIAREIKKALVASGMPSNRRKAFLAGLAILPPPIPMEEYASLHGVSKEEAVSFCNDLGRLLERTPHGIIFRDEPADTYVRKEYGLEARGAKGHHSELVERLKEGQRISTYAAEALPELLVRLDLADALYELALSTDYPKEIQSDGAGKLHLRSIRLRAALGSLAAEEGDGLPANRLLRCLSELAIVNLGDARVDAYTHRRPDLTAAFATPSIVRRLVEDELLRGRDSGGLPESERAEFRVTHCSVLAIVYTLAGEPDSAAPYVTRGALAARDLFKEDMAREFVREHESLGLAAFPFHMIVTGGYSEAAKYLSEMEVSGPLAFDIAIALFNLLEVYDAHQGLPEDWVQEFISAGEHPAEIIAALLSLRNLPSDVQQGLVKILAKALRARTAIGDDRDDHWQDGFSLTDSLFKSAAIAISLGNNADAFAILDKCPEQGLPLHNAMGHFVVSQTALGADYSSFIVQAALFCACRGVNPSPMELVPNDMLDALEGVDIDLSDEEFMDAANEAWHRYCATQRGSDRDKELGLRFLSERLWPAVALTRGCASVIYSAEGEADEAFMLLLERWGHLSTERFGHYEVQGPRSFMYEAGLFLIKFVLWARPEISASLVQEFLRMIEELDKGLVGLLPHGWSELVAVLARRHDLGEEAGELAAKIKAQSDKLDTSIERRADILVSLARAILPASRDDAKGYFLAGVDDARKLGEDEDEFVYALLHYVSRSAKSELEPKLSHRFGNLCQLNLPYRPHKFAWENFGRSMANIAGPRSLAQLARWEDRQTSDRYEDTRTPGWGLPLPPVLLSLLQGGKITPGVAVAMLWMSPPVRMNYYPRAVEAITAQDCPGKEELMRELIRQYERMGNTRDIGQFEFPVAEARAILGEKHEDIVWLEAISSRERTRKAAREGKGPEGKGTSEQELQALADRVSAPTDVQALAKAVEDLESGSAFGAEEAKLLELVSRKVLYGERRKYLEAVAALPGTDFDTKVAVLSSVMERWRVGPTGSRQPLGGTDLGEALVERHYGEIAVYGSYLQANLAKVQRISGKSSEGLLAMVLRRHLEEGEWLSPGVLLHMACLLAPNASDASVQESLVFLLEASDFADKVAVEGPWKSEMYPQDDDNGEGVVAGSIWLKLGSLLAAERWRAAHCIMSLARLGEWSPVHLLVEKLGMRERSAHPFQDPKASFCYMDARLWLLMALARLALDFPEGVSQYVSVLRKVAFSQEFPHVLERHFAAQALLACGEANPSLLGQDEQQKLTEVNKPRILPARERECEEGYDEIIRPGGNPSPEGAFDVGHDFDQEPVRGVVLRFDVTRWDVHDAIASWVHSLDPSARGWSDKGGRGGLEIGLGNDWIAKSRSYGQYLSWHSLFLVIGRYLAECPVTKYFEEDGWEGPWLDGWLLARSDGLWLADGMDRCPLGPLDVFKGDTKIRRASLSARSAPKLMSLMGIRQGRLARELMVNGRWNTPDGLFIHVQSTLVEPSQATEVVNDLIRNSHVPPYLHPVNAPFHSLRPGCKAWLREPEGEGLDVHDPLGAGAVANRPGFGKWVVEAASLSPTDAFHRSWVDSSARVVARAPAWGRASRYHDGEEYGAWLVCDTSWLQQFLAAQDKDVLLSIAPGGHGYHDRNFGILHVTKNLECRLYVGRRDKRKG